MAQHKSIRAYVKASLLQLVQPLAVATDSAKATVAPVQQQNHKIKVNREGNNGKTMEAESCN